MSPVGKIHIIPNQYLMYNFKHIMCNNFLILITKNGTKLHAIFIKKNIYLHFKYL